jgi:hypothetical protein
MAVALMAYFLFVAARNVTNTHLGKRVILIVSSGVFLGTLLYGWYNWPKPYYVGSNGVCVTRITGNPLCLVGKKGWVTETEKLADDLAAARPVLDDLQHMVVKASDVGADWVL